jgi:hypothetical protein
MANMHRISWMATALILGGGGLQLAGAQQTNEAPPTYDSDSPPRYRELPLVMPAPLPQPNPYAHSESAAQPSQSPDATVSANGLPPGGLLQVHSDQGIQYVSGGIGEGERTKLDALSNQFNLRLLFAMQGSGEYLSAVRVNILDVRGGTILTAESEGPWFFAQLAPGNYTVEASAPGQAQQQSQRQTAHIGDSHQSRLNFYWR